MRSPRLALPTLLAAALVLAGCGGSDADAESGASAEGYPVSLENCDHEVEVSAAPQRIVSLNQGTTEVLLSLGVADRMVGTATWTDEVLDSLASENDTVERLADQAPSGETVLAQEPDLVTASFSNTLDEGGVLTRDELDKLRVPSYLAPSACVGKTGNADGAREEPFEMDLVHREIRELAQILDVEDEGEKLVGELEDKVATAADSVDADGTSVMFWFANSESPYMAGCCGAPGFIAEQLGLDNVFDSETDEWPQINWETVADRNPDVLIVGDLTRKSQTAETADAKIAFLKSNPVTREMDAVKHDRFIRVTGAEMNPSLRTAYGVENVAAGLRDLGLGT